MKTTFFLTLLLATCMTLSAQDTRQIKECVIENGVLKTITVDYHINTGDKTLLVNGKVTDFETLNKSKEYASNFAWYVNNEPLSFKGQQYVKYGLPRILGVDEIERSGKYKDVGVYVEAGFKGVAEVIYIPVRQGCEFQPYQRQLAPCGTAIITPSVKKVKAGKNVTLTAQIKGSKEKFNYEWFPVAGEIVGEKNKKSVVVTGSEPGSTIEFEVKISSATCETWSSLKVEVIP